jgi:hypothetical protein
MVNDEQLLEDFNREIYAENGADPVTVEYLINTLRTIRKNNKEDGPKYRSGYQEGYDFGYKMGVEKAEADTIMYEDLRKMTIQELANLIGDENAY